MQIQINKSADGTLVPCPYANAIIRVMSYRFTTTAATSVTLQSSDGAVKEGPFTLGSSGGGISSPAGEEPVFDCPAGTDLQIKTNGQVGGGLNYVIIPKFTSP